VVSVAIPLRAVGGTRQAGAAIPGRRITAPGRLGFGWLGAPQTMATDATSRELTGVAAGDLNGDGKADVAVGTSAGVDVYIQGSFGLQARTLVATGAPAHHVLIADVTGDGRNDIVASSASQITLLANTGAGFAVSTLGLTTYESAIAAGDLNGDGRLAVAQLPGTGSGMLTVFSPQPGPVDQPWWSRDVADGSSVGLNGLAVADLTGDGRADLVVSDGRNRPDASINVIAQDAPGHFAAPVVLPSYDLPQTLAAADVNGDGRSDVAVVHQGWNAVGVYVQQPDGTMGAEQLFALPTNAVEDSQGLALGDLNGDGRTDIAIADANWGLVVLRQIDPPAPTAPPPDPTPAPPDPTPIPPAPTPAPPAVPEPGSHQTPALPAVPLGGADPAAAPTAAASPASPAAPAVSAPAARQPAPPSTTGAPFVPRAPALHSRSSSAPLVLRVAELRRTRSELRLRVGWRGGVGRISWSLRLDGRGGLGRPLTHVASGGAAAAAGSMRRVIRLRLSAHAPLHAVLTVRSGRWTVVRIVAV